jgi:hypothetical protein
MALLLALQLPLCTSLAGSTLYRAVAARRVRALPCLPLAVHRPRPASLVLPVLLPLPCLCADPAGGVAIFHGSCPRPTSAVCVLSLRCLCCVRFCLHLGQAWVLDRGAWWGEVQERPGAAGWAARARSMNWEDPARQRSKTASRTSELFSSRSIRETSGSSPLLLGISDPPPPGHLNISTLAAHLCHSNAGWHLHPPAAAGGPGGRGRGAVPGEGAGRRPSLAVPTRPPA